MNTTKLKQCPFCGGEATIEKAKCEYPNYFVKCMTCRVQTAWYAEKERLAASWNRRVDR